MRLNLNIHYIKTQLGHSELLPDGMVNRHVLAEACDEEVVHGLRVGAVRPHAVHLLPSSATGVLQVGLFFKACSTSAARPVLISPVVRSQPPIYLCQPLVSPRPGGVARYFVCKF